MVLFKKALFVCVAAGGLVHAAGGELHNQLASIPDQADRQFHVDGQSSHKALYRKCNGIWIQEGTFDTSQTEHFSNTTFDQLMNSTPDDKQILMLAQCHFIKHGRENKTMYKAIPLLRKIFGPYFFQPEQHRYYPDVAKKYDIQTKEPLIGCIDLFAINKQDPENLPEHIGSDALLHTDPTSVDAQELKTCLLWNVDAETIKQYDAKEMRLQAKALQTNDREHKRIFTERRADYLQFLAEENCRDVQSDIRHNARFSLGELYFDKESIGLKDYKRATEYFKLCLDHDLSPLHRIESFLYLGKILCDGGYGVEKDHQRAYAYLDEIEAQSLRGIPSTHVQAVQGEVQLLKGKMLLFGNDPNYRLAKEYLEIGLTNPSTRDESALLLAKIAFRESDGQQAINYLKPLADHYDSRVAGEAQFLLGAAYCEDNNCENGLPYLELVAKQDDDLGAKMYAHWLLGTTYYNGNGTHTDYQKALQHLKSVLRFYPGDDTDLAKQVGFDAVNIEAETRNILGHIYWYGGNGVDKDYQKASEYFDLHTEEDVSTEIQRFELLAQQNNNLIIKADNQYKLGEVFFFGGNGVEDYQLAGQQFKLVAEQNDNLMLKANAQYLLGEIYSNGGGGLDKDIPIAVQYFELAAAQDDNPTVKADAQSRLGEIYYYGDNGVAKDVSIAKQYFELVATQDDNPTVKAYGKEMLDFC